MRRRTSPLRMRGAGAASWTRGRFGYPVERSSGNRGRGAVQPSRRSAARAHHRIDPEQVDAAQQEREHRRRQVAAAGEPQAATAGAVFQLGQDRRQSGAADRVDRAGPALAVERPGRLLGPARARSSSTPKPVQITAAPAGPVEATTRSPSADSSDTATLPTPPAGRSRWPDRSPRGDAPRCRQRQGSKKRCEADGSMSFRSRSTRSSANAKIGSCRSRRSSASPFS